MSILETFYILFKSDASEVKKGAEEAKKSTDQLNDSLKNTNKSSESVGKSFIALAKEAALFFGAVTAGYKVLNGLSAATNYTIQLGDISRELGVNVSALDAWGNAVQRFGGTSASFQNSLNALSKHFGTSANIALQVLPQLADVFQRLSRFRAIQYGKILGLDTATILLLQQGRREVESIIARQKELGLVNAHDVEVAQKFRLANLELELSFRSLNVSLSQTILPALTKFYNLIVPIVDYLKNHKDLVIGAFIGIGIAAAIMLAPFIIASAPILATAAAISFLIGLFAIAYEDLKAFMEGNDSLIGRLLEKWPAAGQLINDILDNWKMRINLLIDAFKFFQGLFDKVSSYFKGDSKITFDIQNGQNLLGAINQSPLTSQTSNSIFSRSFARNASVNTGPITVHTQATDAVGISKDIGKGLQEHIWQTANEYADGVAY